MAAVGQQTLSNTRRGIGCDTCSAALSGKTDDEVEKIGSCCRWVMWSVSPPGWDLDLRIGGACFAGGPLTRRRPRAMYCRKCQPFAGARSNAVDSERRRKTYA